MNDLEHGLGYLFNQERLQPADLPIIYDCAEQHDLFSTFNLVLDAIAIIKERLYNAGYFFTPDMCLIVPEGSNKIPPLCGIDLDVFEYGNNNTAYLLTVKVGGASVIFPPDDMTWLQWSYAVQRGESPSLIITMPWAQAKFVNWR